MSSRTSPGRYGSGKFFSESDDGMTEAEALSKMLFFAVILGLVALVIGMILLAYIRSKEADWMETVPTSLRSLSSNASSEIQIIPLDGSTSETVDTMVLTIDGEEAHAGNVLKVDENTFISPMHLYVTGAEPDTLKMKTFQVNNVQMIRANGATTATMYVEGTAITSGDSHVLDVVDSSNSAPVGWTVELAIENNDQIIVRCIGEPTVSDAIVYWHAVVNLTTKHLPLV